MAYGEIPKRPFPVSLIALLPALYIWQLQSSGRTASNYPPAPTVRSVYHEMEHMRDLGVLFTEPRRCLCACLPLD